MSSPPPGVDGILSVLDSRAPPPGGQAGGLSGMGGGAGEMLRNEALLLLPNMLAGNADLQKIIAFSGAFEKLFEIIGSEGGSDGGIVVQDAMTVVGCLLRFNVSNQVCLCDSMRDRLIVRITLENYPSYPLSLPFSASQLDLPSMTPRRMSLLCSSGPNKSCTTRV